MNDATPEPSTHTAGPEPATVAAVARQHGVSHRTVRRWCSAFLSPERTPLPCGGRAERRGKRAFVIHLEEHTP